LMELAWIPDCYEVDGWKLLQTIAKEEFGAVYTNEYGQIVYLANSQIRNMEQVAINQAPTISDDHLLGFMMNPTYDQYRNAVSISWTHRQQEWDYVYKNTDALDFRTPHNTSITNEINLKEVVSLRVDTTRSSATAPTDEPIPRVGNTRASAVLDTNQTIDAVNTGWGWGVIARPNQRSFGLHRFGGNASVSGSTGVFFGAYIGGQKASIFVKGKRYSEPDIQRITVRNEAEVAAKGERVLIIPDSEWRNNYATADALADAILPYLVTPAPIIENISITADPRLQLLDVVRLESEEGITGALYAQIIGKRSEDRSNGSSVDYLTMRVAVTPATALWDDPGLGWDVGRWAA
jgi:hypothetical protein